MDEVMIRIAALEQLVKAMLKDSMLNGTNPDVIKQRAQGALLESDVLGGPEQKTKAREYLESLLG